MSEKPTGPREFVIVERRNVPPGGTLAVYRLPFRGPADVARAHDLRLALELGHFRAGRLVDVVMLEGDWDTITRVTHANLFDG